MKAAKNYVERITEEFRLAGMWLLKAEANYAKGFTLHRLEEKVAAQGACERSKKRLARAIMESDAC